MIAVRPPEYFPRQEFMALLMQVDVFVLADTCEFSRKSYQSRCKLRNPDGWQWCTIPTKSGQSRRPITEVRIENREKWITKHWRAFQYNYRSTPYFEFYEPDVEPFFEKDWEVLAEASCRSTELLVELLNLETEVIRASSLGGDASTLTAVLSRMEEMQGVEPQPYLALEESAEREAEEVNQLHVLRWEPIRYEQNFEGFEQGMSFADLLFNYGPDSVGMLREGSSIQEFA